MTCEEVKISLHDYIDEITDDFTKREVESHIRNCDKCIKDYKKLVGFLDRLKELPIIIDPPKDILEEVHAKLLNLSEPKHVDSKQLLRTSRLLQKERARQEKEIKKKSVVLRKIKATKKLFKNPSYLRRTNSNLRNTLLIVLPLFIMALGYLLYDLHKYNSPWKVISIEGIPKINEVTSNNDLWNQGSTLSTDAKSKAKIIIPNIGEMGVDNNSKLLLEKGKEGANIITFEKGMILIKNNVNMPELTFYAGAHQIIDRGGEFAVKVDENGNVDISVKQAFVETVFNGEHYFINEDYECELPMGKMPGVPYHKDASDSLKIAIESFVRLNAGEGAVEKIVSLYKEKDILTLLALIPRVPQLQRQILFQEISNHFPPPESITRAGIIRLDKEMLYKWWEEIEWQL